MNREDIIRMAREAGFESNSLGITYTSGRLPELLERFAALVASAAQAKERSEFKEHALAMARAAIIGAVKNEREACAKWLEDVVDAPNWAEAIRARGQA